MLAFLAGDADVLVSTTIIESGLDIPQANTLIVERADALGLAQLYQIRGRVGRSDEVAHAFLFYPDGQELTQEARARLATLADHTELGSGFAIAMRDLEIRGAGNLLGAEQSGHVAAIGFELYVELLGEAVAELSGTRRAVARPVRVDAQVDAYVPADYMPAEAQKIDLHRRLALVESEDELRELHASHAGPLRARPRARREPVRDPGGEAEARPHRGGLPRLPGWPRRRRAARPRLGRAARRSAPRRRPPSTRARRASSPRGGTGSPRRWRWSMVSSTYGFRPSCPPTMPFWSRFIAVLAALALAVAAAGCGGDDDDGGGDIDVPADAIAVVGDKEITKAEYDRLLASAEKTYEAREQEFPAAGTPEFAQLRNAIVRSLVEQAQFEIAAEELDVTVTDEDVDKRLAELKEQFFEGDEQKYKDELEAQGLTEEQVKSDLRTRLLSEKVFEQVTNEVEVTDEDVQAYYEENEAQFDDARLARRPPHPRQVEGEGRRAPRAARGRR